LVAWLGPVRGKARVFDTRMDMPAIVTGAASRGIARQLRHRSVELVARPQFLLVTKANQLKEGEEASSREWGERVAALPLSDQDRGLSRAKSHLEARPFSSLARHSASRMPRNIAASALRALAAPNTAKRVRLRELACSAAATPDTRTRHSLIDNVVR
jgi:hypothetical protein